MSELKQELEALNKKHIIAQEKLKTAKDTMKDIGAELKEKYKIDPKVIQDPTKLKALIDKQNNNLRLAKEKALATLRALNDRITIA